MARIFKGSQFYYHSIERTNGWIILEYRKFLKTCLVVQLFPTLNQNCFCHADKEMEDGKKTLKANLLSRSRFFNYP